MDRRLKSFNRKDLFVIVAGIVLGTVGMYVFKGPVSATFAFFYFIAILSAVTYHGLFTGLGVALFASLISLPAVLSDPILQESKNFTLYIILHVGLPAAFAFGAYQLVYRYERQRKQIDELSQSQVKMSRALDEELTRMQLLYQISEKLKSEFQLHKIGDMALDALLKITHAKGCSVWWYDESQGKLVCIGARGVFRGDWQKARLSPGEGISGLAFRERRLIHVTELGKDFGWENKLQREGTFTSALSAPLLGHDKPIGAITILDKIGSKHFSKTDEKLMMMLSSRIAVMLENALLYKELKGQLERTSSLLDVARNLIEVVDLKKLFQVIIENAVSICGAGGGYLLLINREGMLEPKAYVGFASGFAETLKLKLGEGLSGKVAETGQSICALTFDEILKLRHREIHWADISSAIWMPLLLDGKSEGVMCIYTKKDQPTLTEEHKSLLETFAGLAVLAIERSKLYEDMVNTNRRAVEALAAALDAREPSSARKQRTAARFIEHFTKHFDLSPKEREALELAAYLYDIGKIGIPDALLGKAAPLEPEERSLMEKHVYIGADIVGTVDFLKDVVPLVYLHHERVDGKGYPLGLKGDDIPLGARILSVLDGYLSMRQERPYRKALSHEEALEQLRKERGRAYDPKVLDVFEAIIDQNGELEV